MSKGLKNRFSQKVFEFWKGIGWRYDLIDDHNDADCLHHIISPSSRFFKKGDFNKSIFNSCPLNNFRNHLYNPSLHKPETEKRLLKKVAQIIMDNGHKITERDARFYKEYKELYN